MSFWTNRKVLVTGAGGFLGQHVVTALQDRGASMKALQGKEDADLRDYWDTAEVFRSYKPDVVVHLAAVVGGIGANRLRPADFFIENAMMGCSILTACRDFRVEKLVLVGTTCSYPKFCPAPFDERSIWDGYPEETNAPYGIAKRALVVGAAALRAQYGTKVASVIPTNLYGPGDNFDPKSSHVIPALIRKMHEAKDEVTLWGSGKATRDFLYVKDAAAAIALAAEKYDSELPLNLGSGEEISIKKTSELVAKVVGFKGRIIWDRSKPDGQPRRLLDTSRARKYLGWHATTPFQKGLEEAYETFLLSQVPA